MQPSKSYFGLVKINLTPASSASSENTEMEQFDGVK
jgi:hypothetical protein